MKPVQLFLLAVVVPVAAWLLAVAIERYRAFASSRPPRRTRPLDERLFFAYMAVSFTYDAYTAWTQNHLFRSGAESTLAALAFCLMCEKIWKRWQSRRGAQDPTAQTS